MDGRREEWGMRRRRRKRYERGRSDGRDVNKRKRR